MNGTPVDSAWMVIYGQGAHSGSWHEGFSYSAITDTLLNEGAGIISWNANTAYDSYKIHIGTKWPHLGWQAHQEVVFQDMPSEEVIILVSTPVWIEAIGGRNPKIFANYTEVFLQNIDNSTGELFLGESSDGFTPGIPPRSSAIQSLAVHPHEVFPVTRSFELNGLQANGFMEWIGRYDIELNRADMLDTLQLPLQ